jgi:hypothetical protein
MLTPPLVVTSKGINQFRQQQIEQRATGVGEGGGRGGGAGQENYERRTLVPMPRQILRTWWEQSLPYISILQGSSWMWESPQTRDAKDCDTFCVTESTHSRTSSFRRGNRAETQSQTWADSDPPVFCFQHSEYTLLQPQMELRRKIGEPEKEGA